MELILIEELIDFFRILKNNIVFLLIIIGVGALSGYLLSVFVFTNHYSTQMTLTSVAPIDEDSLSTYNSYLKSDTFVSTVKEQLEKKSYHYSDKQIDNFFDTKVDSNAKHISVLISTQNKNLTYELAQLIPNTFMKSTTVSADTLSKVALYQSLTDSTQPTLFEQYLEKLLANNFFELDKAIEKNDITSSVRIKKNVLMGALTGLVFFFFILLIKEFINDTIKNKKFVEEEMDLPVLTTLKK